MARILGTAVLDALLWPALAHTLRESIPTTLRHFPPMKPLPNLERVRQTLLALHPDLLDSPEVRQSLRPSQDGVIPLPPALGPTEDYVRPEASTVPPAAAEEASTVPPAPTPMNGSAPADASSDLALLHLLGQGGMGEVWAARQVSLDRIVAVKRIRTKGDPTPAQVGAFVAEAIVTADLEHPNIVPIHARATDEQGRPLIAMKLVQALPGTTFSTRTR